MIPGNKLLNEFKGQDYITYYGINIYQLLLFLSIVRMITSKWAVVLKFLKRRKVYQLTLAIGICFVFLGIYISNKYSAFPIMSQVLLVHYSQVYIIGLVVALAYLVEKKFTHLVNISLLFSLLSQALVALLQFFKQADLGSSLELVKGYAFYKGNDELNTIYRPSGTFQNSNQFGLVLLLILIMITGYLFKFKNKLLAVSVITITFVVLILTQSRSVWLGGIIYVIGLVISYRQEMVEIINGLGMRRIIYTTLFLLITFSYILLPRISRLGNFFYQGSGGYIRWLMIKEASFAILQNPLFGYGPGTNEITLFSYFPFGSMAVFPTAVHNGFIQFLLEFGVTGTMLFGLVWFFLIRSAILSKKAIKNKNDNKFILWSSLSVMLIYFLFQPYGVVEFTYIGLILARSINI
jgi:O-antigen ligase